MLEHLTIDSLSRLDRASFMAAVGAVFEHSPWVMERAWERRPFANRAALLEVLRSVLAEAERGELLALINAHPELAGKAAVRGDLTADSAREQAGAGLNACTPEEFASIQQLNSAYRERFGWPFIIAVKGLGRQEIIAAMAARLTRRPEDEFAEALAQILRIASLRLDDLISAE